MAQLKLWPSLKLFWEIIAHPRIMAHGRSDFWNSRPSDIACLKEGRECHSILPKVEEMWDQPLENLKKIENPCEIDESESDKNEMVIFDE